VNVASPRVGDHRFCHLYEKHLPEALRVVIDRDMVPGVPQQFLLFEHIGHEAFLDEKGYALVDRTPIERAFVRGGKGQLAAHTFPVYDSGIYGHMDIFGYSELKEKLEKIWEREFDETAKPPADEAKNEAKENVKKEL